MKIQTLAPLFYIPSALAAIFPPPSGPYNTTLTTHSLTDHNRLDPYSSTPQPRKLMISFFQPRACNATPTPYMDPSTASWSDAQFGSFGIPAGTFASLSLLTCPAPPASESKRDPKRHLQAEIGKPAKPSKGQWNRTKPFPLVIFSPGLGNPRGWYSFMAQEVASQGFTVLIIDHPYDAGIVVFPDNSTIMATDITTPAQIEHALNVRVADVKFVLNYLSHVTPGLDVDEDDCDLSHGLDVHSVGIFGHSLGGATAAEAMLGDERLKYGVNLDGSFFGSLSAPSSSVRLTKPFLIVAHEGKNTSTDASWAAAWRKMKGFKRMIEVKGSAHGSFEDLKSVADVLGLGGLLPPEVDELLGKIDGLRAARLVTAYLEGLFGIVLKGEGRKLLDGESKEWPEVAFQHPDA